ncbi:PqiC family protein [Geomonas azotofigens]|uniref:PqiC family protein n=1 Tax=Geomonas azotofigens TaxID=2843196 RepID=UPI001C1187D4|nr:PqiC family protein [Geomonas azotofigens]MBU5613907.1 PqiC family protein [Geomonas azotofigens]
MTLQCSITGFTTLCLAVALLAGCSSSPRVSFYTLNVAATDVTAAPPFNSVDIGPITLPDLLDRPQLVVRTSATRVEILETHRWAESPKSEIPRIIAADLGVLLKPVRVSFYPQNAGLEADYRVLLDIQRFEMANGEGVGLEVLWSVRRSDGGVAKTGRTVVDERVSAAGYDALVAAQSRALAAVSRDLAQALCEAARTARSR